AVETSKSLNSALEDIQSISNINLVNAHNEGKLVHVSGPIHVEEPLTEPEYGVSVPAVILKRRVQMYQWVEIEENNRETGDQSDLDRKYTYLNEWRDKLVDSNKFRYPTGHHNPKSFPINSGIYISDVVRIGAFVLSDNLKRKFNDFTLVTSDERPERRDIKMHAGLYYHALDVWNPEVGDTRVQFSYAGSSGDVVSIIGRQIGSRLGESGLVMLEPTRVPAEQMITNKHNKNVWMIRLFRTLGWLCVYVSTTFFGHLIHHFEIKKNWFFEFFIMGGKVSPYFSISASVSVVIVSSMWLFYKPWIGVGMASMAFFPLFINAYFKDKRCYSGQYHQL
ncbi:hypothetical protein AAG570_008290, partial [Ranatra chinensis]